VQGTSGFQGHRLTGLDYPGLCLSVGREILKKASFDGRKTVFSLAEIFFDIGVSMLNRYADTRSKRNSSPGITRTIFFYLQEQYVSC
jgi:hypothetical protein